MSTAVTRNGQVTIPESVRQRLGLKPGTLVDITMDERGQAILRKVDAEPDLRRLEKLAGFASWNWTGTTEEFMQMTRGDAAE